MKNLSLAAILLFSSAALAGVTRRAHPHASRAGKARAATAAPDLPVDKIYGANMGNWLVSEPWMSPSEWLSMQGEFSPDGDCSHARQSEWSLATFLGQEKTNEVFQKHWQSWMTQDEVDGMVAAKLNSVRIPYGFWIIEDLVDRATEPYAQGGLDELIRGLAMFKAAGLKVMLDHHALPGVSASKQMFAGNCTDQVAFYSSAGDHNYKRAVAVGAVLAWLSHAHPAFGSVFSLHAVNEPTADASQTPGLGGYYAAFVRAVRAVETAMGIEADLDVAGLVGDSIAMGGLAMAAPIVAKLAAKYDLGPHASIDIEAALSGSVVVKAELSPFVVSSRTPLSTVFMNQGWQNNGPANPADAKAGPQFYDQHLYLNFGGVAPNATEESYLATICNSTRTADAALVNNAPLVTGEWSLATAFNTTNEWLQKFSDAQKMLYSQGGGWMFWNWKIDEDAQSWPILGQHMQWSYKEALASGVFTADPADYFDADVCKPYM